ITLRDGDSIFVATNTNPNPAEALQLADATFAADKSKPLNVVVVGEVYRPGSYVVTAGNFRNPTAGSTGGVTASIASNPTVTQAIQVAGGIKPQADLRRIQIRRPTRSGTEQIIAVDLFQLVQAGDLHQDVILQSGDTITIPVAAQLNPADASLLASASFAPDTIRVNMVGEVKQPGSIQLPPNTTLSQALLAAGGFDPRRAKQGSVQLIRLNPDGTALRRDIPVDFAKGINEQTNPVLRNNDIIVIGRSTWTQFSDGVSNILPIVGNVFGAANFLNLFGLGF
ncbi:MAG TPA: SLBB domain-containing protein, partial [Coleofasciculaceae cyanobacterium]